MIRGSATPRLLVLSFAMVLATPLLAVKPGTATGTASVDKLTATLAYAVSGTTENLFDETKKDTVVVLTDRALGDTSPADEIDLSMRARRGDFLVYSLRLDGAELVSVTVAYEGFGGLVKLPGAWFEYRTAKVAGATVAGSLKLARRESDGHTFACSVEFAATAAAPVKAAAAEPPAVAEPTPTLPPASTSTLSPKALASLLVQAMMDKDEIHALELITLGADPNGRDQYGAPVLNWAVMMCQPRVVKALVDKKADLKYERAPGMTVLTEAGACPEAAKILKAAGAR